MMNWKLRIKDRCGNTHVHRFADAEAAYRHWTLYIHDGTITNMTMWKLMRNIGVTGIAGEEVWRLHASWPKED